MGTLYSFTVARRPVVVRISPTRCRSCWPSCEWDEGPRFSTELVNVEPEDVTIGMRVSPVFCDYPEHDVTMLRYEPARRSDGTAV